MPDNEKWLDALFNSDQLVLADLLNAGNDNPGPGTGPGSEDAVSWALLEALAQQVAEPSVNVIFFHGGSLPDDDIA